MTIFAAKGSAERCFLDANILQNVEMNVKNHRYESLTKILEGFSYEGAKHEFLSKHKEVGIKLLDWMGAGLEEQMLSQELVKKVTLVFLKHQICQDPRLAENVEFETMEGKVYINKSVLLLQSDYFFKTLSGQANKLANGKYTCELFQSSALDCPEKSGPSFVPPKRFSMETVKIFKSYMYFQTLPPIEKMTTMMELYKLAYQIMHKNLISEVLLALYQKLSTIDVEKNLDVVLSFVNEFQAIIGPSLKAQIEVKCVTSALKANEIAFNLSDSDDQEILLKLSDLYLLNKEGLLADLIRKYTKGLLIEADDNLALTNFLSNIPPLKFDSIKEFKIQVPFTESQRLLPLFNVCKNLQHFEWTVTDECTGIEKFTLSPELFSRLEGKGKLNILSSSDEKKSIKLTPIQFNPNFMNQLKIFDKIQSSVGFMANVLHGNYFGKEIGFDIDKIIKLLEERFQPLESWVWNSKYGTRYDQPNTHIVWMRLEKEQ